MMNDIIKHQNSLPEALTEREIKICQSLHVFNQLRDFKLDALQVIEWKDTIQRLAPDADPEKVQCVIDNLILGELDYDPKLGIHNIFKGLKRVRKNKFGEYELITKIF